MIMKINELKLHVIELLSLYGIQSVGINGEGYKFSHDGLEVHFAVQEGVLGGKIYEKGDNTLDCKLGRYLGGFAFEGPPQDTIDRMVKCVINTEERISSRGSSYTNPSRCSSK